MADEGIAARKCPRIIWRRDPEFASAARAEHAFVEGYELVAFDIPPGKPGQKRTCYFF